eukprot:364988-Chlamydomonas_euryale.AAC.32
MARANAFALASVPGCRSPRDIRITVNVACKTASAFSTWPWSSWLMAKRVLASHVLASHVHWSCAPCAADMRARKSCSTSSASS